MHITKWKKPIRKSNTYRMIPVIRHLRKGESVGKVKRSLAARGSGGVRGEQDWWNVADFSRAVKLPCKILRWRIWDTEHLPKPEKLYSIDAFVAVVRSLSHVWLFATPWTAACQASLSSTICRSLLRFVSTHGWNAECDKNNLTVWQAYETISLKEDGARSWLKQL